MATRGGSRLGPVPIALGALLLFGALQLFGDGGPAAPVQCEPGSEGCVTTDGSPEASSTAPPPEPGEGLALWKTRRYGGTAVSLYQRITEESS